MTAGFYKPDPAASLTSLISAVHRYSFMADSLQGALWQQFNCTHTLCFVTESAQVRGLIEHTRTGICFRFWRFLFIFYFPACNVYIVTGGRPHSTILMLLLSSVSKWLTAATRQGSVEGPQSTEFILWCWQDQDRDFDPPYQSEPDDIVFKHLLNFNKSGQDCVMPCQD